MSAVALIGGRAFADTAADIEQFYNPPNNPYVTYDNASGGPGANGYPVITAVASQPGTTAGHFYTGWSVLVQDDSPGSLDLFISTASLTNLPTYAGYNSMHVGDEINVGAQWSPFDQIPELSFTANTHSNNYLSLVSTGNATPTPNAFSVSQVNLPNISNQVNNIAGFYLEMQNVTISGSTGSYSSTFPMYLSNIAAESYTITDNTGSMTMFDWTTSYSGAAALGGTAVPTGPVDIYGFVDDFGSTAEFVPLKIVPEPSTVMLVGTGLLGLLALRRRRS
jgi:hypothetical protein